MSPLVSVPVLTYNSALFIEETLESVYNQTYQNIELIVSDDCSKDNTVEIVNKWCQQERVKKRFANIKIITVPKNTGIPANYNRCVNASSGEWIKMISGDDALMPNCVKDNVEYVENRPEIKVLYSFNRVYKNTFSEQNYIGLNPSKVPSSIINDDITSNEQYKLLLISDRIAFTPSRFLNKSALIHSGLPDENLFSEDYQLKLGFTKNGFKLHFMQKETVLYRQHDLASSNTVKEYIIKPHYFKTESFRKKCIYPYIPFDLHFSHKFSWIVNQIYRIEFFNT
jgi:glycosyltransferase involved in cell wall biosynthesis